MPHNTIGHRFAHFMERFRSQPQPRTAKGAGRKKDKGATYPSDQVAYCYAPGRPVWSERNYQKFCEEGYSRNVIAHRCISMIASGAAAVPWDLFRYGKKVDMEDLGGNPILTLLTRPNPCQEGVAFFEAAYSTKLISGNAFILAITNGKKEVKELHCLRPDRVSVEAAEGGVPSGYRYRVNRKVWHYPMDRISGMSDIFHFKSYHPMNDWYGMSSMEAAAYAIDQHNQAAEWNQSLLQHAARPSGALVVTANAHGNGGTLDDTQYGRLRAQIDTLFSGARNAGRPLLLENGLQWCEMSLSPKEMDFLAVNESAARNIALAFGVPPQLLGIPGDNTYNNMAEARLSLWEQTILPLMDRMAMGLNHWLLPRFGKGYSLRYDKEAISALAPRREALWNRLAKAGFLTMEEKRRAVGLGT